MTAIQDLDGLVESRKKAYEKSETLQWITRPKTAATVLPETRERISTAPASLPTSTAGDIKKLKVTVGFTDMTQGWE